MYSINRFLCGTTAHHLVNIENGIADWNGASTQNLPRPHPYCRTTTPRSQVGADSVKGRFWGAEHENLTRERGGAGEGLEGDDYVLNASPSFSPRISINADRGSSQIQHQLPPVIMPPTRPRFSRRAANLFLSQGTPSRWVVDSRRGVIRPPRRAHNNNTPCLLGFSFLDGTTSEWDQQSLGK